MKQEEILKFAQKSIYTKIDYLGKWKGFDVWEPGFDDEEEHCVGFPSFILVKGSSIRWTLDWEESREIMHTEVQHIRQVVPQWTQLTYLMYLFDL